MSELTVTGSCACDCCSGITARTPADLFNRAGLPAISYRVGTHGAFKATMLARLSSGEHPALRGLRARDDRDGAIALIDAWATIADVLTFYQERIANECFLGTATERLSLLHLARLIGYELSPGVAAETDLAFTLEDVISAPEAVELPAGTRVQSVPAPGEQAQTFETVEPMIARRAWNAITPERSRPQVIGPSTHTIWLAGTGRSLKRGDGLLMVRAGAPAKGAWAFSTISAVSEDAAAGRTRLELATPPEQLEAGAGVELYVLRRRASIFGHNAPAWRTLPESVRSSVPNGKGAGEWPGFTIFTPTYSVAFMPDLRDKSEIELMTVMELLPRGGGSRAVTFMQNESFPEAAFTRQTTGDVFDRGKTAQPKFPASRTVDLDAVYDGVLEGTWIVFARGATVRPFMVSSVTASARADFLLTAKVSRLTLEGEDLEDFEYSVRDTTVFAESERVDLAEMPVTEALAGSVIPLHSSVDGLLPGRKLAVTGCAWDAAASGGSEGDTAAVIAEIATIAGVSLDEGRTVITLAAPLRNQFDRAVTTLNANVARATHGETVTEIVGSGDASQAYQQWTLRQAPLTHVIAATSAGRASSLSIEINGVHWTEVDHLPGQSPGARVFATRLDESGRTIVQFGDGVEGARPPSGSNNIRARYRKGIGVAGHVQADQLTQLLSRPLGLKAVTNPEAAAGGEDPESAELARRNAPLTVLTLGRAVSLQDYEDFASAFAGIGKANAAWISDRNRRVVAITVAGADGALLPQHGATVTSLLSALRTFGDRLLPIVIRPHRHRTFDINGQVLVDPSRNPETVLEAVRGHLVRTFSFASRRFAQPVFRSEIIAAIHVVEGVHAVSLTRFGLSGMKSAPKAGTVPAQLVARGAEASAGAVYGAELLLLDESSLDGLTAGHDTTGGAP